MKSKIEFLAKISIYIFRFKTNQFRSGRFFFKCYLQFNQRRIRHAMNFFLDRIFQSFRDQDRDQDRNLDRDFDLGFEVPDKKKKKKKKKNKE